MAEKWYKNAWRRSVIDMHIDDWDERFLTKYDPKRYAELLAKGKADSAVLYAHSHVGHSNYPTKVGHQHGGLKGRDIFGETVDALHERGIKVVAYYSLIFNNWAYDTHVDWRMVRIDGKEAAQFDMPNGGPRGNRYGVCCPNSPYREFIKDEIAEICNNYDFEGVRFDMTFWPTACYCKHCAKRFAEEVGGELPRIVDWTDPQWVKFQRCRERWLLEFAAIATNVVKELKPGVSIEHQSSTFPLTWQFGVTSGLARECTFLQGDFYGGQLQQSFVCKQLYNLTAEQPFGYETSVTHHLGNFYKTLELLKAQAYAAIANSGAFIYIDAIDPMGTINPSVYDTMGEALAETKVYDAYLGGEMVQDVAIYLSTESKFYLLDKPEEKAAVSTNAVNEILPHTENALRVAQALINENVPYGVITKESLGDLSKYKLVVLPNVTMMSEEEADALRKYVEQGGKLYGSMYTSLYQSKDGSMKDGDFQLGDVFGIQYKGKTEERITFIKPEKGSEAFLAGFNKEYPLNYVGKQLIVEARNGAEVLGTIALPYTNPDDPKFASIHCNPVGRYTDHPSIVRNSFGKGTAFYIACEFEKPEYDVDILAKMLRSLLAEVSVESNAPSPVEITVFDQPANKRFIVNALNFQNIQPPLPVSNVRVRLNDGAKKYKSVKIVPCGEELSFVTDDGGVEFELPSVELFRMVEVCYE